jgi:hypothetical protein
MANLQLEQAALLVNRAPDAIERWILDGRVDAERAGGEWLVDSRSLLNAAVSEDVALNGNGHAPGARIETAPVPDLVPEGPPASTSLQIPVVAAEPSSPAPAAHDRAIADVATVAIQALNARLEQAIGEVERLQDERLKLALQLGYAQAQLKACSEQLKALSAPAEPSAIARLWRRLTGRASQA